MNDTYLHIKNLEIAFDSYEGEKSVLKIDELKINKGESFGLIGESGTGKTVLALSILNLIQKPPGIIKSGEIFLDGVDLLKKSDKEMQREVRGKKIAMIFQDPMSTLNPVFTVGKQLINNIVENQKVTRKEAYKKAIEIINKVKLSDAEKTMNKYPHELSGGQRQRIIIAMALVCGAEFIIADEPTRNLDVTIQAGILKLIKKMQEEFKVTVLFIANNLELASLTSKNIAILYKGEIIEKGSTEEVLKDPRHPYTYVLLNAVPKEKKKIDLSKIIHDRDSDLSGSGCIYYNSCNKRKKECKNEQVFKHVDGTHYVKCHFYEEVLVNE
jgi:oligopeptide/dipeptide ABC transporter ATP-binding protein